MRLLLTSGGITNPTINNALVDLLGKPIAESTALLDLPASGPREHAGPFHAASTNLRTPRIGERDQAHLFRFADVWRAFTDLTAGPRPRGRCPASRSRSPSTT